MIGTGMGTSGGLGYTGIYGQQPWQEEARRQEFQNRYIQGLQMQTTAPMAADPMQKLGASAYATSFLPQGSTLGGGMTSGSGLMAPFAPTRGSKNWWQNMPQYQFPMR